MVDYKQAVNKIRAKCFIIFPTNEFGEKHNHKTFANEQIKGYKKEVNDLLNLLGFTVIEKAGLKLLL